MALDWRTAKSLLALRDELNKISPNRGKLSDGTKGDAAHASRSSDHNPWVKDGKTGVVTGMDLTNDPAHGVDSEAVAEALRTSRDERIKYIISNRKIMSGSEDEDHPAWVWRKYTGSNAHNHHVHISVKSDKKHYDDVRTWGLADHLRPERGATARPVHPPVRTVLAEGVRGPDVERMQQLLVEYGAKIQPDAFFGERTKEALQAFQRRRGLHPDGICGPYTWDALHEPEPKKAASPVAEAAEGESDE